MLLAWAQRRWHGGQAKECINILFDFERYLDIADILSDYVWKHGELDKSTKIIYHPIIFGDGSRSTMHTNIRWAQYAEDEGIATEENPLQTPMFLKHLHPNAKLVVMFRNPVDATFSAYTLFGYQSMSIKSFHHCVLLGIDVMHQCEKMFSEVYCTILKLRMLSMHIDDPRCNTVLEFLQLGRYHLFLKEWLKYYPGDQFFFIQFEECIGNESILTKELWSRFGIRRVDKSAIAMIDEIPPTNMGVGDIGDMLMDTQ